MATILSLQQARVERERQRQRQLANLPGEPMVAGIAVVLGLWCVALRSLMVYQEALFGACRRELPHRAHKPRQEIQEAL